MNGTRFIFALAAFVSLTSAFAATDARAAGLYFSDRGVRPMGRGGAFVAGADDLGAVWYNPAGLADAGTSVLVDFSWLHFGADYTRQLSVTQNGTNATQTFSSPTVSGSTPILPLPTFAASYNFGDKKQFTLAAAVIAPYVALTSFPSTVNGAPSPARYSMGSYDGSLMAIPGIYGAWKPTESLRIGFGLLALVGTFKTTVTFNTVPADRLLASPEEGDYDASAQISAGPIFAPTATAGVIYSPEKHVRVGMSGQLPMIVSAPATLDMKLPTASEFDAAHQDGRDMHVRFVLPAILRLGVEARPIDKLRVEVAYVREFWSSQQSIDVHNVNVNLDGVASGVTPNVKIPDIAFPRNFQDSSSYRVGAEYMYEIGDYPVATRAGISYESSAVPPAYLSLASLDFDKVTLALGGSLYVGEHWRFDGLYAHTFVSGVTEPAADAKIPRINPLNGGAPFESVNGGTYSARADLIGLGLNYRF